MPLDGWSQLEAVIVSTLHVRWWMHPFTIFLKKICGAYDLYIADMLHRDQAQSPEIRNLAESSSTDQAHWVRHKTEIDQMKIRLRNIVPPMN